MITVIGLGIKEGDLAMRAVNPLRGASCVLVRNECPSLTTLRELNVPYRTLDFVFEKSTNSDTIKKNILSEIKNCAKPLEDLCYCVEGSVFEDPAAVELIEEGASYIDGVSKASSTAPTPLLEKKRFTFDDVVEILKRLRAPDGCPWDRVQTHESIRINAIEEAYELVDAIDLQNSDKICEEAGDVLMQSLFHTLIEEEKGNFSVEDMLTGLCVKLISRHTHVFGKDKATNAENALSVWDRNKMKEKNQTTFSDAVCDVPACFPALLRAQKICKRVEKGGWDRDSLENVKQTLLSEFQELEKALAQKNQEKIYEETGDFLLSCARLCRAVGIDGEMALLDAGKKLQNRYVGYEKLVRADGKDPTALTKEERDFYYAKVKNE